MRRVGASIVATVVLATVVLATVVVPTVVVPTVVVPTVVVPTVVLATVVIPTSGEDCARRHSGRTIVHIVIAAVIAAVPVASAREPVLATSVIATSSTQLTSDGSRPCLSPSSAGVVAAPADVPLGVISSQLYGGHSRCGRGLGAGDHRPQTESNGDAGCNQQQANASVHRLLLSAAWA
jgi:hypothetical protein